MSQFGSLGLGPRRRLRHDGPQAAYVVARAPLQRILACRARSIDDIVNSPLVKNEILGYWKLQKHIDAVSEVVDLENQWNKV